MQLVKNGPDIPDKLLHAHEDGRVVFFCGAGISYPAGLPGFGGLTTGLYEAVGTEPTDIEKSAIKKQQFDTAIGLLEERVVGGRPFVRGKLVSILTPDLTKPRATATHQALLTLARTRTNQFRLITTNFDRVFETLIPEMAISVDRCEAPRLPIPKTRLNGLVYLHGLLPDKPLEPGLDALVLSSGDFGRAYLTERWAARFVSELFRNYTVCFVGYSINDPVLRYMVDALAADRLLGESSPEVYAFGSHTTGGESKARNEWEAKHVTPILYRENRRHAALHQTLILWAENYRDGIAAKESIVSRYASGLPQASTIQDDFIGRVLWALGEKNGLPAKRFAELDPPPPLAWLEHLSERRFGHHDLTRFGVQPNLIEDKTLRFSLLGRPATYALTPWMGVVNSDRDSRWDEVMFHLARWMLRHLDDPALLLWVVENGGTLHPRFHDMIRKAIEAPAISPAMRTLWDMLLSGRVRTGP